MKRLTAPLLLLAVAAAFLPSAHAQIGLNKSCDAWNKGRKGLEYFLMVNVAEDSLKTHVNTLKEGRNLTKDPLQGVGEKDVARWLDDYCDGRPKDTQDNAMKAYAGELVSKVPGGQVPPAPKAEARAAAAAPEPSPLKGSQELVAKAQGTVSAQPGNAEAWRGLGRAYVMADLPADAARAYREALRLSPSDRESWYELGGVYSKLGDQAKVNEVYQKLDGMDKELAGRFFRAFILPR